MTFPQSLWLSAAWLWHVAVETMWAININQYKSLSLYNFFLSSTEFLKAKACLITVALSFSAGCIEILGTQYMLLLLAGEDK